MTRPVLVLVHGRAQGGRDEAELKAEWIETLGNGLAARRERLDEVDIRFPFYGKRLDELLEELSAGPPAEAIRRGAAAPDTGLLRFQQEMAEQARLRHNVTDAQIDEQMPPERERGPLQWEWVQATLRTLDKLPGLSGRMIERFTRDVHAYLSNDGVRDIVNQFLIDALSPGEKTVLVGHSLGSVVTYDVLMKQADLDVPLYVTVGSPLAVRPIRRAFEPTKSPPGVGRWYNAFDRRDAVALYPLDTINFAVEPAIENYMEVHNGTPNAHGISGYLSDAAVAGRIFDGLFPA